MKANRSIPPVTVIPVLVYPDVRAAVDWLKGAFGFAERTRIGDSHRAQMSIGPDGAMIVADVRDQLQPPQPGVVTQLIKVRVDDVEAAFERARGYGAQVLQPPTTHQYGERECTVEDLAGHRWQFTETMRDVAPEEYGCQTVSPWPGAPAGEGA
ncbi:MAG: VOC family protein [Acidimicrobiales bacterium]